MRAAAEDELCLLLARATVSQELRARISKLLTWPLDWNHLLQRAKEHQIFPLVYTNLRNLTFSGVPEPVRDELTHAFHANAARNMFLASDLTRILRVLGEGGVPVIPLKGIALADSLYGDPAFRVCSDLDILVPPASVLRARRLLLDQGYTSPFTEDFFVKHQFRTSADCSLQSNGNRLPYLLEIHWTLLQQSSRDLDAVKDLWDEARPKTFFEVVAYAPSAEWEFLFLAWHAASHKWQTLKWLADIHDLSASGLIDWRKIREKAERFDLTQALQITLTATTHLFGSAMPDGFAPQPLPPDLKLFPASLSIFESEQE